MDGFEYEEEIVDEDDLDEEDTDIYGEPEGLSDGYGTPVDASSYREDSNSEPDYSGVKGKLAKYQDTIGTTVGAASGAMLFTSPELALATGAWLGASYAAGKAGGKGMSKIKDYLSGNGEKDGTVSDEKYATA